MNISKKYGRTYHYPFSPGTTSDDRINHEYWQDVVRLSKVVHTEKLDGENNCLNKHGVFARSHALPTQSPWTKAIRDRWELIKNDFGEIEIFGENLYAIHSIEYRKLEHHYYVFAVRNGDKWLSWDEVKFYAEMFDFPTVPELSTALAKDEKIFKDEVLKLTAQRSVFDSYDTLTAQPCSREGIVTRDCNEYLVDDFPQHVFKYVRKNHVKTDEHWTKNWRRAKLLWENSSSISPKS